MQTANQPLIKRGIERAMARPINSNSSWQANIRRQYSAGSAIKQQTPRAMWRFAALLVFWAIFTPAYGQAPAPNADRSKAMDAPALPFYDWNACPFEGCAYRRWTARKPIVVYDTWKAGRRSVTKLSKGEKVVGLTGVVITIRPGVVRMDRDLAEVGLQRGDAILVYTNQGEGVASAWFKGRFYPEFDLSFARGPADSGCLARRCAGIYTDGKYSWWARIKTRRGVIGWVMAAGTFDGQDLLGDNTGGR
jgi:hypothetical protein